jgi:hypothetical protein
MTEPHEVLHKEHDEVQDNLKSKDDETDKKLGDQVQAMDMDEPLALIDSDGLVSASLVHESMGNQSINHRYVKFFYSASMQVAAEIVVGGAQQVSEDFWE